MIRLVMLMVAVVAVVSFGCAAKPSEEECRSAISNMQTLMGTDTLSTHEMVESQVRRCKGGSNKKSVDCAIKATTLDELRKCDFYKVPENAKGIGATPGAGSAAGSAGSAAGSAGSAGSAAAGSAAAGSAATDAAGSAGTDAAGSAGSATEGSAAAGSAAAGSAASAAPAP